MTPFLNRFRPVAYLPVDRQFCIPKSEPALRGRHDNQVHMIGHQTVHTPLPHTARTIQPSDHDTRGNLPRGKTSVAYDSLARDHEAHFKKAIAAEVLFFL